MLLFPPAYDIVARTGANPNTVADAIINEIPRDLNETKALFCTAFPFLVFERF